MVEKQSRRMHYLGSRHPSATHCVVPAASKPSVQICYHYLASPSAIKRLLLAFEEESHFMESDYAMLTITRTPTSASVFYDTNSFCEQLRPSFKILSVAEEAYWFQTAILLEK